MTMDRLSTCPKAEMIDRHILGDLPEDERATLRKHVVDCSECSKALADADHMETLLVGTFREVGDLLTRPHIDTLVANHAEQIDPEHPIPEATPLTTTSGRALTASGRLMAGSGRPRRGPNLRAVAIALNLAAFLLVGPLYLGYATVIKARDQALLSKAKTDVKALSRYVVSYQKIKGTHPPDGIENVIAAINYKSPNRSARVLTISQLDKDIYFDPWGKPYRYCSPKGCGNGKILVYSIGVNGRDEGGTGDDLAYSYN